MVRRGDLARSGRKEDWTTAVSQDFRSHRRLERVTGPFNRLVLLDSRQLKMYAAPNRLRTGRQGNVLGNRVRGPACSGGLTDRRKDWARDVLA